MDDFLVGWGGWFVWLISCVWVVCFLLWLVLVWLVLVGSASVSAQTPWKSQPIGSGVPGR